MIRGGEALALFTAVPARALHPGDGGRISSGVDVDVGVGVVGGQPWLGFRSSGKQNEPQQQHTASSKELTRSPQPKKLNHILTLDLSLNLNTSVCYIFIYIDTHTHTI